MLPHLNEVALSINNNGARNEELGEMGELGVKASGQQLRKATEVCRTQLKTMNSFRIFAFTNLQKKKTS